MSLDDRDYLHEDSKRRIRLGQMDDIYYNPKEFRRDRQATSPSSSSIHRSGARARPGDRRSTNNSDFQGEDIPEPSRFLWFFLGALSSFLMVMSTLVIHPKLLSAPFLWVQEWLVPVMEWL